MRPHSAVLVSFSFPFSAIAALTFAPIIAAQSTGGRIRGTVSDPSGGAVAGAKVTLINEATNVSRDVDTGGNGEYLLIEVPIGSYEIDVTQEGFKKYVRKGIALNLNEVISVDISLQLGATAETVEVTGAPPVVDTSSTQLGAVVNERASTQLPLNQRDVYQLLQLQPGVQSQLGNDLFYGSDKAGVVTVNGGRGRSNNYSVNGGDGNDLFANLPAIEPSPDSHRGISRHQQFVRRRIRPQLGRRRERRHEIRHQRDSRQLLRIFPQRRAQRASIHVLSGAKAGISPESVWRHHRRPDSQGQDIFLRFL